METFPPIPISVSKFNCQYLTGTGDSFVASNDQTSTCGVTKIGSTGCMNSTRFVQAETYCIQSIAGTFVASRESLDF